MPRCSCCAYDNEVSPALKERRADVRKRKTAGEWQSERKIKKTTTAVNHSLCVCGDGLKFWSDPQTHTWIKRGRQFCSVGAFLHIQSRFFVNVLVSRNRVCTLRKCACIRCKCISRVWTVCLCLCEYKWHIQTFYAVRQSICVVLCVPVCVSRFVSVSMCASVNTGGSRAYIDSTTH